jgi:urease accessory protein
VAHDRHEGPLRVLRRLYPEGPGICHHVVVHPPGGIVGGDELHIDAHVGEGGHALITTPGAARFYRSEGATALQRVQLRLARDARLEWLPMETLAYSGCQASSQLQMDLAPGAQLIGWDLLVLGLPASGQGFEQGAFQQHLEVPGRWLERGRIAADDPVLLDAAAGLGGHRVLGTAWFVAGEPLPTAQCDRLLEAARDVAQSHPLARSCGITAVQPGVLVLRVLAGGVEPAMSLLAAVRAAWRSAAWGLAAAPPRIWAT